MQKHAITAASGVTLKRIVLSLFLSLCLAVVKLVHTRALDA